MTRNSCLNLIFPRSLEERIIDHLLERPEWVGPFVTHPVDGHGAPGNIASDGERVRGRAERAKIEILMVEEDARKLVAYLKEDLPGANVTWWISPIVEAGGFQ